MNLVQRLDGQAVEYLLPVDLLEIDSLHEGSLVDVSRDQLLLILILFEVINVVLIDMLDLVLGKSLLQLFLIGDHWGKSLEVCVQ